MIPGRVTLAGKLRSSRNHRIAGPSDDSRFRFVGSSVGPAYSVRPDICIYAAGVSNSNCGDAHEFDRERQRVGTALNQSRHVDAFVYFGTCSTYDPQISSSPYVQHKLAMERMVRAIRGT